jgi:alkanesulfonate monooxygenase SsuD/methylene tetrahydromethanopterin reductase-like flavin-dependent oxidoreductase (luciferase family)
MQIGMCMPYMELDYNRDTTLGWCRGVDDGPFSSLSCGERITSYAQDMRIILAAAAALTRRVRIVPSLYVLPMHSAVWAAKEIASLDVLSAGRVTVTVGIGGRENDYRAVNASFARRGQRLEEQVAEMRRIWAGAPPFPGADPVGPTPVQAGGPPIWGGAMTPQGIARAARWADGNYNFALFAQDPQPVVHGFRLAEEAWAKAGRTTRPRHVSGFWFSLADDAETKLKRYVYEYVKANGEAAAHALAEGMITCTPDAIRAALDRFAELGCDELFLVPATAEIAEVERMSELLAKR